MSCKKVYKKAEADMIQTYELKQHPILSIIVPVYNVEKYLRECLDSLVNQNASVDSYEIICIDDGSPDNCGAILDEYEQKYQKMRVIHQENAGQAMARNAGVKSSSGEYIWFIDSDDFIPKYAVSSIIDTISNYPADIYWIGMYQFLGDSVKYNDCDLEKYKSNIKLRSCYSVKSIRSKSFLNESGILYFDNNVPTLAEDYLLHFKIMKSKPVEGVITEKPLYFYRYVDSSTSNTLSPESLIKRVEVWSYILKVQKSYFETEKKKESIMTAIEMQDSIKGIFHWLSLLENNTVDCFKKTFNKDYLPYVFSFSIRCIYLDIRAFFYRRIVNSYNQKHKYLFKVYNFCRESNLMKKSKKKIKKIIRR